MNAQKFEKYAACFLVAVLTVVLGIEQVFAAPSSNGRSAAGVTDGPVGCGQPTCAC